jgi:hypothetical protein
MNHTWRGSGNDNAGMGWTFTLNLSIDDTGSMSGEFYWESSDGIMYGTEYVNGTNFSDSKFKMEGKRILNYKEIVLCKYNGQFSGNYSRIEGSWTGDCTSGSFSES